MPRRRHRRLVRAAAALSSAALVGCAGTGGARPAEQVSGAVVAEARDAPPAGADVVVPETLPAG